MPRRARSRDGGARAASASPIAVRRREGSGTRAAAVSRPSLARVCRPLSPRTPGRRGQGPEEGVTRRRLGGSDQRRAPEAAAALFQLLSTGRLRPSSRGHADGSLRHCGAAAAGVPAESESARGPVIVQARTSLPASSAHTWPNPSSHSARLEIGPTELR